MWCTVTEQRECWLIIYLAHGDTSRREPLFTITSTLFMYLLTSWHTKLNTLPWCTLLFNLSYHLIVCFRLHSWSALLLFYLIPGTQPKPYGTGTAYVYLFIYQSQYVIINICSLNNLLFYLFTSIFVFNTEGLSYSSPIIIYLPPTVWYLHWAFCMQTEYYLCGGQCICSTLYTDSYVTIIYFIYQLWRYNPDSVTECEYHFILFGVYTIQCSITRLHIFHYVWAWDKICMHSILH
jgi:hypothetical protein